MNKTTTILSWILLLPICMFAQLESYFQHQLDSLFDQNKDAVGVLMHVESPDQNLSFTSAVGFSDRDKTSSLSKEQPVLLASNTNPYVAVTIMRLVEMGKIELDQSINTLMSRKLNRLFSKDGYDLREISVRHLLSHTSGIADYVDDAYFDFVNENPLYDWKKKEQLQRSIDIGEPLFVPGTDFSYGDINYLLLTEIIERATAMPFCEAIKKLLKFEALKLNHTWFKNLEPYPQNTLSMSHQYSEKDQWDSYQINPSWDLYGGGGIAATVRDAALFFQYLFEGNIIENESLLKEVYQFVLPKEKSNYCLGFRNISFPTFTAYYHGGWWGTDIAYCPETNSTVASFTLQKSKRDKFAKLSIAFMKKLALEQTEK